MKIRVVSEFFTSKGPKPAIGDAKTTSQPDPDRHPPTDTGFPAIRAHAANPSPPKCKAEAAAEVEAETAAEVECVCVYACMCYVCVCVCVRVRACMYV